MKEKTRTPDGYIIMSPVLGKLKVLENFWLLKKMSKRNLARSKRIV